jgi:nucleoside-diphosphate-sugar epimerase
MDAVGAIDIGEAGRPEHDCVAFGLAVERMGGRLGMVVGLDLDNEAAYTLEQQRPTDQIRCNLEHAACEEASRQRFCGVQGRGLGEQVAATQGTSERHNAMRIFLAGATGAIGRRLVPLLLRAGHVVDGTTRSREGAAALTQAGANPVVLDVFDAPALAAAVSAAAPEVIIHQLTDLPREFDQAAIAASYPRNARIRTEGTRNLLAAARAAKVRRVIVQSIAFAYAPGGEPHPESDPLNLGDPERAVTVKGTADMERQVLALAGTGMEGILLRYGLLYGPGTWTAVAARRPALHVDAAAHAALLAVTRGNPGIYNIADDDGAVSIAKARAELGFDPSFRLT